MPSELQSTRARLIQARGAEILNDDDVGGMKPRKLCLGTELFWNHVELKRFRYAWERNPKNCLFCAILQIFILKKGLHLLLCCNILWFSIYIKCIPLKYWAFRRLFGIDICKDVERGIRKYVFFPLNVCMDYIVYVPIYKYISMKY